MTNDFITSRTRESDKVDHSIRDYYYGVGSCMIDFDFMAIENIGGRKRPFAGFEIKHPNLSAVDSTGKRWKYAISLDRDLSKCAYSLDAQRQMCNEEFRRPIPHFVVVNWTKGPQDPDLAYPTPVPMFFLIPTNRIGLEAMVRFSQSLGYNKTEHWQSEREHAKFINSLKQTPQYISDRLVKMSGERMKYKFDKTLIDFEGITDAILAETVEAETSPQARLEGTELVRAYNRVCLPGCTE